MTDDNLEFLERVERALKTQTTLLGEVHDTTIEQGVNIINIKENVDDLKIDFKSHKKDIYDKVDDMVSKKSLLYWATLSIKIVAGAVGVGIVIGATKGALALWAG